MSNAEWYRRALGRLNQPPAGQPEPVGFQRPAPQPQASQAPTGYQGTAAEQAWHGQPVGKVPIQDAIRQHRGTVAQEAMGPCPNCGSPDGFTAVMPGVGGDVASNATISQKMLNRGQARTGHCFYCGYRSEARGAPVDGAGYPGVATEGEARRAHGLTLAQQATRRGNQMVIDHSLVGQGAGD